jgi:hypothetical protein
MRISSAQVIASFASIGFAHGFSIPTTAGRSFAERLSSAGTPLYKGSAAAVDDWNADFDPSASDNVTAIIPSNNRDSGRKSAGSNSGDQSFNGHDYTRDTSADNSNVNLVLVNALIADRLKAWKARRFQDAEAIRHILLNEHRVSVWDKGKIWRSKADPKAIAINKEIVVLGRDGNGKKSCFCIRSKSSTSILPTMQQ